MYKIPVGHEASQEKAEQEKQDKMDLAKKAKKDKDGDKMTVCEEDNAQHDDEDAEEEDDDVLHLVCFLRVLCACNCTMNIAEYENHGHELEQNHATYGDHSTYNRSGATCICSSATVNGAFDLCPLDKLI